MVLLTCDSDINLALMSSSATEVTAARLQRQQRRGGGVSAHDSTYEPITYELLLLPLMLLLVLLLLDLN